MTIEPLLDGGKCEADDATSISEGVSQAARTGVRRESLAAPDEGPQPATGTSSGEESVAFGSGIGAQWRSGARGRSSGEEGVARGSRRSVVRGTSSGKEGVARGP